MKKFISLSIISCTVLFLLFVPQNAFSSDTGAKHKFYVINLRQEINKSAFELVKMGLEEASSWGADYCILNMNTYGGAVDAADSIRTAIIHSEIPVAAFINSQAASAGALIAISCDSIYMRTGSSIGAATVVNQSGEVMPDKYQSFMRAMMRSTAESHGKKKVIRNGKEVEVWVRDPRIAQAMVSKDSVLSFTPGEAIAHGYCEGMAGSIKEVIGNIEGDRSFSVSGNYIIKEQHVSLLKKILFFLMNPLFQGLCILLIIGGIYFELQSPGIGFPLAAAVAGALLYFSPLYLEGLVQNWELIAFVLGVLLLFLEILVIPGFGVAGISGIILIVFSLVFAMVDNDVVVSSHGLNLRPLLKPSAIVLTSCVLGIFGSVYLASRLYGTKLFSFIALDTNLRNSDGFVGVEDKLLHSLKGKKGTAVTVMKPSGFVEVDGKRYPAQLDYGFAEKGTAVEIYKVENGRLYCSRS
jgi:membrane-bound serine protease (ClpP class)